MQKKYCNCVAGLIFVLSMVFTASVVIAGEASYTVTNLGSPSGLSRAYGINERGKVIGVYDSTYPFLYTPESGMLEIETIGGLKGWALDINDSTEVVGYFEAEENKAFLWIEDGGMQELPNGDGYSAAIAINNLGQVVGESNDHPVLWTEEGEKVNLGTLAGAAVDINDDGQILIHSQDDQAYVWTEEHGMVPLETLGGEGSTPRRINDRGEIVGWSQIESGEYHAFFLTEENGIVDLGTLGGPQSIALSINNVGQVVGHSDITPADEHAFIWQTTTGMQDLNDLIPLDSGCVLLAAYDINDAGQIVGEGKINGQTRAFLLTPVIEVKMDIKPVSCPNPLNTKSKGVLPVAILGTGDFDVTQVDVATVQLEGISPLRSNLEDVATPFSPFTGKEDCSDCTDAGPDGFLDLTLKFDAQEVVTALGDVTDRECRVLTLTGNLMEGAGGNSIAGEDVVVILEKGGKKQGKGKGCGRAVGIPKTGQTTRYAEGDDGDLQMGIPWPDPRFTDNGDGTVRDELTGLIWLENANCFGPRRWVDALTDCNNLASGECGLSDGSSAGDWHLPSIRELESLIDYGRLYPALPAGHPFTGVMSSQNYWSSSTYLDFTDNAWVVDLYSGSVSRYQNKWGNAFYVWPVRGCK